MPSSVIDLTFSPKPCQGRLIVAPKEQLSQSTAIAKLGDADRQLIQKLHEQQHIFGGKEKTTCLPSSSGEKFLIIVATDDSQSSTRKTGLDLALEIHKHCTAFSLQSLELDVQDWEPACLLGLVEGLQLKQYAFKKYKKDTSDDEAPQLHQLCISNAKPEFQRELSAVHTQALGTNWARDLANEPGNGLTPSELAKRACEMAEAKGLRSKVLGEQEMTELKMGSLLSVSKGSREEAKLIMLEYQHPEATETISLVGKGLTFDAGGISLKPSAKMEQMKFDMCGAAAVLGAMHAIAELKPKVNIHCIVPSSENLPDGQANKPGDIVTASNGLSIEVDNTDAEGRLILADALAYTVKEHQPDKIIDLATLTGAVIMCFSHQHAAILGNDEDLASCLQKTGDEVHERVWPLPLLDEHKEWVKGRDADLNNTASSVEGGGTIKGAAFLSHFIGDTPWAHLDIAGTAWGGKAAPYTDGEHATGFGVRLLSSWVCQRYGRSTTDHSA